MSTPPTTPPPAKMPRQIPYIIGQEGCERLTFYGMRNILTPFLITYLLLTKAESKEVFHSFVIGVYFFPVLGGWISDRLYGKYRTILAFSLIYCVGLFLLAALPENRNAFYTGLFLIALGAGGIKPLVASFVGDQFDDRTKHLAKKVFDAFYWIINFGSFFGSFFMPLALQTWGPQVAFGIPAILMIVATIVLWAGRNMYVMVPVAPANPNSFMRVVKTALVTRDAQRGNLGFYLAVFGAVAGACTFLLLPVLELVPTICLAFVVVLTFGGVGTWIQLERARGHHPDEAVDGVRAVLRVLVIFALVTPFHSLFDQKATTWVLQGGDMYIPPELDVLRIREPAQMQAFNPLLVMILIPFNNLVLYPWLRKLGWEPTSLRRMTAGILFSAFAWVAAGLIQIAIEGGDSKSISILWQLLPYALLTFGEVLVSATGLEFAYSQAPLAMKGVIMSFWNLTTTVGNLWVLLVNAAIRNDTVTDSIKSSGISVTTFLMFFFAAFAGVATLVFWLYSRRYRYVDHYRAEGSTSEKPAPLPAATARDKTED
ncbi:MAG: MFS transporter [Myxococcales bacterium]|nr:MFS transporter [Myxococcales bacterium]